MRRVVFQIPAINPERGFDWDTLLAHEDQIGLPNPFMLSDRQSAQSSIESAASLGDELLMSSDFVCSTDTITAALPCFFLLPKSNNTLLIKKPLK